MSYLTISKIAANSSMRQRVAACAAKEGQTYPENWAFLNSFHWAVAPEWDTKWEYALAANPNSDPGANEAVITDNDILAVVQQLLANPFIPVLSTSPTITPSEEFVPEEVGDGSA